MSKVIGYRTGTCRNDAKARAHLYAETAAGHLWPMCDYGWNRSNGARFSIFRGPLGSISECAICERRRAKGLRPIIHARPHKTRWL